MYSVINKLVTAARDLVNKVSQENYRGVIMSGKSSSVILNSIISSVLNSANLHHFPPIFDFGDTGNRLLYKQIGESSHDESDLLFSKGIPSQRRIDLLNDYLMNNHPSLYGLKDSRLAYIDDWSASGAKHLMIAGSLKRCGFQNVDFYALSGSPPELLSRKERIPAVTSMTTDEDVSNWMRVLTLGFGSYPHSQNYNARARDNLDTLCNAIKRS